MTDQPTEMSTRTVKITYSTLITHADTNALHFQRAIGYMATWAPSSRQITNVMMYVAPNEIDASYQDANGAQLFFLAGILDRNKLNAFEPLANLNAWSFNS